MTTINLNEFQPAPLLEPMPLQMPINGLPLPYVETQADYRPLGTAQWSHDAPNYQDGDFWLGRDDQGNAIGLDDDRHILLNCKARGGKGISYIVPNLCQWQGSSVVIDPKGENAILTARRRADGSAFSNGMGQKVKILDPFGVVNTDQDNFADIKGCFNSLDLIDIEKPESVDDAARIAESIVSSENTQIDPFWDDSARAFLKSIILHVATAPEYKDDQRNLVTVRNLVLSGEAEMKNLLLDDNEDEVPGSFDLLFEGMRRNQAFGGVISRAGEQLLELSSRSDRTLASLIQVASTHTELLDSPQLQKVITQSDFELSELKTRANGMSLYLCLPQRFMETHHRWLRMMTSLTITEMERIQHQPKSGKPVLMILDEFAGLKRMKVIENAAAQIAGFGVKMMFVTQSLGQLKAIYKENWETFLANTGVKIFFGNDDHFSREHISKLIGECEVMRKTHNASQTSGTGYSIAENKSRGGSEAVSRGGSRSVAITDNWSHGHGPGLLSFSSNRGGGRSVTASESWNESETSSWNEGETFTQSVNYSDTLGHSDALHKRNLVNPNEIGLLFGDRDNPKAIVLISGQQPLQVNRTAYFQDAQFAGLYDPHPDHGKPPTLVARQVSIHDQMNCELAVMLQNLERTKANTERQTQRTITEFEDTLNEAETVRQEGYQSLIRRLSWILPLSVFFIIFSVIAFFVGAIVIAAESGLF